MLNVGPGFENQLNHLFIAFDDQCTYVMLIGFNSLNPIKNSVALNVLKIVALGCTFHTKWIIESMVNENWMTNDHIQRYIEIHIVIDAIADSALLELPLSLSKLTQRSEER